MSSYHYQRIERKWQQHWETCKTFQTPGFAPGKPKLYVLDMFPYPSGAGLHVGHPEGYTATDIVCRYKRMKGYNVLHPMGWDAFGLPAEQYAIKTNTHPSITTESNINTFRRQIKALGFSYDWDREVDTTDPGYYRWTQWIFLQIFDTWFDPDYEWIDPHGQPRKGKGRPIAELPIPDGVSDVESYKNSKRLAYRAEVPVNWCPGLGTVLANEEVIDGKSEVGGFPVQRLPLKQWMLRITSYGDRLLEDLAVVDWPKPIKDMQQNWIGRSEGAEVDFFIGPDAHQRLNQRKTSQSWPVEADPDVIRVYTTRPDTLFGATYMVLSPEHPLVESLTTPSQRAKVETYRQAAAFKSDLDRTNLTKVKTGVFTGSNAINPVNGREIPIWIADYVLMGYGTGAIMAVPGHDERDFEFAEKYGLEIVRVVALDPIAADNPLTKAETDDGVAVHSANAEVSLNGLNTSDAKATITRWLSENGLGRKMINYKLRDWLFSRQRYWGEPFPIVLDDQDRPIAIPESELPVLLPKMEDFKPSGKPEPPLGKATDWVNYGPGLRRETNTMPQWAGSCWYFLRYIDPQNDQQAWSPELEKQWLPVDLYVGGAEHAVLHLLYSRFWYKVLYDRGHVSTLEPFQRLVNQGMILGEVELAGFQTSTGQWVSADEVEENTTGDGFVHKASDTAVNKVKVEANQIVKQGGGYVLANDSSIRISSRAFKMSKSRLNVVNPDEIVEDYGADSLRLYEMFMGPLEATKPWSTKGVEGVFRFLGRAWRMIIDDRAEDLVLDPSVQDVEMTVEQAKIVARTTAAVTDDLDSMRFNTAISRLMEFVNTFTHMSVRPKKAMETFTLLLSPLAPHIAEELWETLGHNQTLAYEPWPDFDPALLKDDEVEIPVQINGKLRGKITVAADADKDAIEAAAKANSQVQQWLDGKQIKKTVVLPGRLINFVII